jgi:hypothetical protein
MPPLIRRYIKTSFAFLIAGVLLGSYISVGQFLAGPTRRDWSSRRTCISSWWASCS